VPKLLKFFFFIPILLIFITFLFDNWIRENFCLSRELAQLNDKVTAYS
jgi:hypothetical protein